ncbi:hypothetical protein HPB49_024420 [Dermacentor silvarum]|uniref:Uncharacterized protein n=1 Tax=Dermacentor silvarum TaxID=543639 RepID=A0ACB8D943_DERSI|nr:hypothetical protein HPB49_024420 [Dermacentor silvarum]
MVSAHVVAVTFSTPSLAFTVVGVYAPPHADIDQYLDRITECLTFVKSGMAVIAGDFNAKHSLWGRGECDSRGAAVLQLVCQHGLHVLNDSDSEATFENHYNASWIDITMVTPAMATLQYEWRISAEESLAEHKHIEFDFALGGSVARKRLTWTGRSRALQSLSELPWFERVQGADLRSGEALEHVMKKFYLIFDRHVSRNLRVVKSGPHTANSWWTPELGTERSRVRAMRRRYQAARDPAVRAQLRAIFTRARGLYRKIIARAQEAALKRYCEESSRRSLFGAPFRTAFNKTRPPIVLPALLAPDGEKTTDVIQSAALLLRAQIPADDVALDSELHTKLRAVADGPAKYGCPKNLYYLLRRFLRDRSVVYRSQSGEISARPTLGSPQGSPLSPLLWNIVIRGLLDLPVPHGVVIQAYADDTIIIIPGKNRAAIERSAEACSLTAELAARLTVAPGGRLDVAAYPHILGCARNRAVLTRIERLICAAVPRVDAS